MAQFQTFVVAVYCYAHAFRTYLRIRTAVVFLLGQSFVRKFLLAAKPVRRAIVNIVKFGFVRPGLIEILRRCSQR